MGSKAGNEPFESLGGNMSAMDIPDIPWGNFWSHQKEDGWEIGGIMEKTKYYYSRDEANRPITTVCLLQANGDVARGVAVCSIDDNPCKKTGRKISRDRAVFAMKTKANSCPIITLRAWLSVAWGLGRFKSSYNPPLTQLENKLLYREAT